MRCRNRRRAPLPRRSRSTTSPAKPSSSSASASCLRQAARQQIEELVVVEPAEVAPWPQTTSSAKISSSGLLFIVAFSPSRSAWICMAPSVFCAAGAHDDLALEHAGRLAVEHIAEKLAALAVAARHARRRASCRRGRLRRAAATGRRSATLASSPASAREDLPPHETAAFDEAEGFQCGLRAAVTSRLNAARIAASRLLADARDMIDLRAVADREGQHLLSCAPDGASARERLDDLRLGAVADDDERAREGGMRRAAGGEQRSRSAARLRVAGRDAQHDAVLHQRRVERDDRIGSGVSGRPQRGERRGVALGQHLGERGRRSTPAGKRGDVGEIGTKGAVERRRADTRRARDRRRAASIAPGAAERRDERSDSRADRCSARPRRAVFGRPLRAKTSPRGLRAAPARAAHFIASKSAGESRFGFAFCRSPASVMRSSCRLADDNRR